MIHLTEKLFPQPTLPLYLGGSGILVGEQLLSMLEDLPLGERARITPYFIDSQEPALRDHSRSRHFAYQNLADFADPIYGAFAEQRFPENLGVSPIISSTQGCGVTRIFGAASLVACRDDFLDLLDQAYADLKNQRETDIQPLQVFLTASSCGGTGAGMIIDAAAMVRHFFRIKNENPRIFMFLIGPSVYIEDPHIPLREDQADRMRASSYALLKELHHFAQGHSFISAYRLRDQFIEIGNQRDDDRLFDWVYYVDGTPEHAAATPTVAEVVWAVAEAQMHLSFTEVGRKVAESLPNMREERVRKFPLHFVHNDNKSRLSADARDRLELSSRTTFLASLGVRSVRFPAEEIKTWFRWSWIAEALRKALRRDRADEERAAIDQREDALGFHDGSMEPSGLFADLSLTREQLLRLLHEGIDLEEGVPAAQPRDAGPDAVGAVAESMLAAAAALVADMRADPSVLARGNSAQPAALTPSARMVEQALPAWIKVWRSGLKERSEIAERLLRVAWDPADGRGLRFLDDLLVHMVELLKDLAAKGSEKPKPGDLEARVKTVRAHLEAFKRTLAIEKRATFRMAVRRLLKRWTLINSVYSNNLRTRMQTTVSDIAALRRDIVEQRSAHLTAVLAPAAWLEASLALQRWRDDVLAPAIIATENALTLAETRATFARHALAHHEGENGRGRWESHTTVQIVDDALLQSFADRLRDAVQVETLLLLPLQAEGITYEGNRLTKRNLDSLPPQTIIDILHAQVEKETRAKLTFLDKGWRLEGVAERVNTDAAKVLDLGAEPLVSFSRSMVGLKLQSYLLRPHDFNGGTPFGQHLDRTQALAARDPLRLGVVTFVYGIPPNALENIRDLYEQYTIHIGDQKRYEGRQDRYPLHVFRDAPLWDEPYSPLSFQLNDELVGALVDAIGVVWANNGGVHLDIRNFNADALKADWNLYVETTEKMLQHLKVNPADADRLFSDGRFAGLQRLYNARRYRAPETWMGGGKGS